MQTETVNRGGELPARRRKFVTAGRNGYKGVQDEEIQAVWAAKAEGTNGPQRRKVQMGRKGGRYKWAAKTERR
jgi:hypothetical protein